MSELRPYQKDAHQAVMSWVRKSTDPCLIDAATGAGKSHIIGAIAADLHKISGGKKVLCLAPSAELVVQNYEKYIEAGGKASIFSAAVGKISYKHPVIFGTPGTVRNRIRRFGSEFCAVVLDECHGISPGIITIIDEIRKCNPNLRVIGTTATPYRLGQGYIYSIGPDGNPVTEGTARDPFFTACVYRVHARELIAKGYLTPPVIGAIAAEQYDTSQLRTNSMGKFVQADIDQAFLGHGRKTARIVADIVAQSQDREGVMVFAATIEHAQEVMASLPPGLSALVTGKTKKSERTEILDKFKARRIKYLVNVSVLTTGFDAKHVDVVAMMRATESVGLMQQIIGRGLRIDDDKTDCLVLDYAGNIDRHCPDGDIFSPTIKAVPEKTGGGVIRALCSTCQTVNEFAARPNEEGLDVDDEGYFIDLDGYRIETDNGPMPAHFGRRCQGMQLNKKTGKHEQCDARWSSKDCPHCGVDNDIAARRCRSCKGEIVDPNEKLILEYRALKRDPTRRQTDRVVSWEIKAGVSGKGNEVVRIDYVTEHRTFPIWHQKNPKNNWQLKQNEMVKKASDNFKKCPETITYQKDATTGFYTVHAYNQPADQEPKQRENSRLAGLLRK